MGGGGACGRSGWAEPMKRLHRRQGEGGGTWAGAAEALHKRSAWSPQRAVSYPGGMHGIQWARPAAPAQYGTSRSRREGGTLRVFGGDTPASKGIVGNIK